jgi:iron complex outermembrane receptor protein
MTASTSARFRSLLLASASLTAALVAVADAAAAAENIETVVVTGTRAANRSKLDTLAPVDVVTTADLENRGSTEFAAALAESVPSLTFPRASVVDATDSIRPATLRGLSPDQTLVLVNGLRQHASALVNINGSVGRGAAAVDLNTIPTDALETVEVLRDGASAQYGSDAIAGVVNLRLKQASSGGGASLTGGVYTTSYTTARGNHDATDGDTITVSAWQGISLGDHGYLTVTGEYLHRAPTGRSDYDPRAAAGGQVTARIGDPSVDPQWSLFANAGYDIADGWQIYGWAGYQDRQSKSAAFPRLSDNVNNVLSLYPNGFLPKIAVASSDLTTAGGVRGEIAGWKADFSVSYGRNGLDFQTLDTLNATYGSSSPTKFNDGSLIYDQIVLDAAFSRSFDAGLAAPLTFAWGLEERFENYTIEAGQHDSYDRGPLGSNTALAGGAQGFVGFQPSNVIDKDRSNFAAYVDLEVPLTEALTVDGAVRFEHYSDFGDTVTGKISGRYDFTPNFALRGSVSTGFRAPSLQQSYFTSTSSVIQTVGSVTQVVETGTFPATSAVATALGAKPLKAEKSKNYSVGAVFRIADLDLTVDAYRIDINDQIVLSELINRSFSAQVAALLDPYGVQAARFFLNGVSSRTRGIDVVGHYRLPAEAWGAFDFTLAGNYNDVAITKVPANSAVLNPVPTLFARQRILTITNGTPEYKVVAATDWRLDKLSATLRATYYGDVLQPASTASGDYWTGNKLIVDLETRYQITDHVGVAFGADNLLDTYPTAVPLALNSNGVLGFPYYSPFGFNGRYVYGRLNVKW